MTDLARLVLDADTRGLKAGERDLDSLSNKSKRTASSVDSSAGMMAKAFARIAPAISATLVVSEFIRISDTFTSMNAQLRLVTDSSAELAAVQQRLFEISQANRVSFEGSVNLYARLARATSTLGVSQDEVLRVTDAVNKALIISGTSAEQASGALAQLGQAFASGALRGDELNSILEQMPRVAQAIAEGMGVTVGELRRLGAEGQLTSEQVFNALLRMSQSIETEFDKMPATVGQAFTVLGNSIVKIVGQFNEASGASGGLADAIIFLARTLDGLGSVMAGLGRDFGDFIRGLQILGSYAVEAGNALNFSFSAGLQRAAQEVYNFIKRMVPAIEYLERIIGLVRQLGANQRGQEARNNALRGPAGGFNAIFGQGGVLAGDIARTNAAVNVTNVSLARMGVSLGGVSSGAGGVGRAMRSAANDTTAAADKMKADIDGIMGRLFPLQGELTRITKDLADLEKARATVGDAAYVRAQEALSKQAAALQSEIDYGAILPAEIIPQFKDWEAALGGFADKAKTTAVTVTDTFRDMATRTLDAFSRLTSAIRGGGFLGILEAVIGLGLQLGSIGVFGKNVQTSINRPRIPSADGGGYTGNAPRTGGMDGKGGFLAMLHPRETVVDHTRGQGMGRAIMFDLRGAVMTEDLLRQMNAMAAQATVQGGQLGADLAQARGARSSLRRVR
ncbi:MAG: hypothetical protein CMG78_09605 [Marinobacter sp.]|nr:hypothetical protein [Marinobacter sp.]|tara:strand:- start:1235 stop:3274 length:2040 start_codon:yes stop_codon:yes gene_type:complete